MVSLLAGPVGWSHAVYDAATVLLAAALVMSPLVILTGVYDWARATAPGTQVRRSANAHGLAMITVTGLAAAALALRTTAFSEANHAPIAVAAVSLVLALVVAVGAMLGGSLVFDYGFNVETAGDHPAWHRSEDDIASWAQPSDKHKHTLS